jgi:hypothetical protein
VIGYPVIALAILDRLLRYSSTSNIKRQSYRLRKTLGAWLVKSIMAVQPGSGRKSAS